MQYFCVKKNVLVKIYPNTFEFWRKPQDGISKHPLGMNPSLRTY